MLSPLAWVFYRLSERRRRRQSQRAREIARPLIVVGNLSVGGTGKTPVIIELIRLIQGRGLKPGVISRGYGRQQRQHCQLLDGSTPISVSGDEPALIFQKTGAAVVVCEDRLRGIDCLIEEHHCDVILADDGLQHYRMARDVEIVVVDGSRMFGNGHVLPVGPLRELPERLATVDWVLLNTPQGSSCPGVIDQQPAHSVYIHPVSLTRVATGQRLPLGALQEFEHLCAVVGLGNPNKFFTTLDGLDLSYERRIFPDHHPYVAEDFAGLEHMQIIMTEKDAVKCAAFVAENVYALNVVMSLPESFVAPFMRQLEQLIQSKHMMQTHQALHVNSVLQHHPVLPTK